MNTKIKNTLEGRAKKSEGSAVFNPVTMFLIVLLGIFSFSAYFVLSGFSDNLKSGNNGSAHALSRSAVGYAGLMHLLKEEGNLVDISRSIELPYEDRQSLRIISLSRTTSASDLDELDMDSPTLIILPKWNTTSYPGHKGWVRKQNSPLEDVLSIERIQTTLEVIGALPGLHRSSSKSEKVNVFGKEGLGDGKDVNFYNFEQLQTLSGGQYVAKVVTDKGPILAKIIEKDIYILSDPDFLNTYSVAKPDIAEFGLNLLYMIEEETDTSGFIFDLSLHGFTRSRNFIKLALTPPFLSVILCLLAMAALIGWQASMRFGSPAISQREIALGKLSLILNAADFIKRAGREYKMAPEYVALTKKLAVEQLHLPRGLTETEINERLDAYSRHAEAEKTWSELEHELHRPKDAADLMLGARKLFKWRESISNGRQTNKNKTGGKHER